jgi:hypothetical protein
MRVYTFGEKNFIVAGLLACCPFFSFLFPSPFLLIYAKDFCLKK